MSLGMNAAVTVEVNGIDSSFGLVLDRQRKPAERFRRAGLVGLMTQVFCLTSLGFMQPSGGDEGRHQSVR